MTPRESFQQIRRDTVTVPDYRLWVNEQRTTLVRLWNDGTLEIAQREAGWDTWGPPVTLTEEQV